MSTVPDEEIVEAAQRFHCDRIIMATCGKMSAIDTLINDSTTQQAIRNSAAPVLVFP